MTTHITPGALAITSTLAFVAALTTVIGLYFLPKHEKALTMKDVALALLFAVIEPFSYYGHSDITIFAIHAMLAFLVYIVSRNALLKLAHLDVRKNRIPHH